MSFKSSLCYGHCCVIAALLIIIYYYFFNSCCFVAVLLIIMMFGVGNDLKRNIFSVGVLGTKTKKFPVCVATNVLHAFRPCKLCCFAFLDDVIIVLLLERSFIAVNVIILLTRLDIVIASLSSLLLARWYLHFLG